MQIRQQAFVKQLLLPAASGDEMEFPASSRWDDIGLLPYVQF